MTVVRRIAAGLTLSMALWAGLSARQAAEVFQGEAPETFPFAV